MEIILKTKCGENTCASEPGKFCRFFATKSFGTTMWCSWFNVRLLDKDGWVQRAPECKEMFKEETQNT